MIERDGYSIVTSGSYGPCAWLAHLDSYDGAPDTRGKNSRIGYGATEQAAIEDLLELLGMDE